MSYFYGFIQGHRGDATRVGSKDSGFTAWAQNVSSRITIHLSAAAYKDESDRASIVFGSGHSTGYGSRSLNIHPDAVVAALDTRDPKIERIWQRIEREFERLDEEAPKAIKRQERRRARQKREDEREHKRQHDERVAIVRELDGSQKARLARLTDCEWDAEGNPDSMYPFEPFNANLRVETPVRGISYVAISVRPSGAHQKYTFDVTNGQWVLPFSPEDLNIVGPVQDSGYGYRVEGQGIRA